MYLVVNYCFRLQFYCSLLLLFMKKFNFHTHSTFCDGHNSIAEMCESAIQKGLQIIGFSSHAPVPFKNNWSMSFTDLQSYNQQIKAAKDSMGSMIQVFHGLEADFIPERTIPFADWYRLLHLDYIIGGIHFIAKPGSDQLWAIDGDESFYHDGLATIFGGDVQEAVKMYYLQLQQMVVEEKPDIIAHLDKVVMNNKNRYFNESELWYQQLVDETLDVIASHGSIVEINTRGLYKHRHPDFFPSISIIGKCVDRGIPLTISADAHAVDEVDAGFALAADAIIKCGGRHIMYLNNGRWNQVPIIEID